MILQTFKERLGKFKKIGPIVFLAVVLIFIIAFKSQTNEQQSQPSGYVTTSGEKSVISNLPVDQKVGEKINRIEEDTQTFKKLNEQALEKGLKLNSYTDTENMISVDIITNDTNDVVGIRRPAVTEIEKNADSLKEYYELGAPEAIMYPSRSSGGIVHVYPHKGVAIVFEDFSKQVYYVVTFDSTSLAQFKQIFGYFFQSTPDRSVY